MKKTLQIICLFLSLPIIVQSQTYFEDFESYNVGIFASQGDHSKWIFDSTATTDPVISSSHSYSGNKALKFLGYGSNFPNEYTPVEAILPVINDNLATISFQQYMDTFAVWSVGASSYISLNNVLNYGPNHHLIAWIVSNEQQTYLRVEDQNYYFPIVEKQWVEYRFELNYLTDTSYFYYNDSLIATWNHTIDISGNSIAPSYSQVNSIRFRTGLGEKVYYDDIRVDQYLVSTKEEQGIIQNLNIYPNPTTGFIHINTTLNETSDIQYQLYDVTGRVVDTWQEEDAFNHQSSRDLSHLVNGMYYLKMIAGTTTTTKKVMLLK